MVYQEENELGRGVLRLAKTIIKNRNRHLEALGLTGAQADALLFFLGCPAAATAAGLGKHLDCTHQTAQGLVQRLAAKQLVTLTRSGADGRCQLVQVTAAGADLGRRLVENRQRTGGKLLAGLSARERAQFIRLVERAYENVKND